MFIALTYVIFQIRKVNPREEGYKRHCTRPLTCPTTTTTIIIITIISHCYKLQTCIANNSNYCLSNEHINRVNIGTKDLDHISAN
jgi:hypothetical protein